MRKALMAAQRMADDLVQEAERKKAEILAQAEKELRDRQALIARDMQAEEYRLKKAQQQTAAYVEKVRALHVQEEQVLARLEELYPPETKPAVDPVEEKASEIDNNVQRLLARAMEDAAAENLRAKAAEEGPQDLSDTAEFPPAEQEEDYDEGEEYPPEEGEEEDPSAPTSRISFGELQFGRDYEIT